MKTKYINDFWEIYDRKAERVKATVYGTYLDAEQKYGDIPGIEIRRVKDKPTTAVIR